MRRLLPALMFLVGCQTCSVCGPGSEPGVTHLAPKAAPCHQAEAIATPKQLDLAGLWTLALTHNPELTEAAAEIDAAYGQARQARAYPNPVFYYQEELIGSRTAPQGNFQLTLNQEIVTAGKRKLDQAIAARGVDQAALGLTGQRYELLRRLRRGYYDYVNLVATAKVNAEMSASLEESLRLTRQLVEKARTRPQSDLLALETLLEEARINQARTSNALKAAWQQLAADVGLPHLPPPESVVDTQDAVPRYQEAFVVGRVLGTNSALARARVEIDSARLAVSRAQAEAIPNVTVGGGYMLDNMERTAGGMVMLETPLPLWDRKQGHIQQAQARYTKAVAAARSVEVRLQREVAEVWARYQSALYNVERLRQEVLPRQQKRRELLHQAYQAGAAQTSFSDVLMAEQAFQTTRLNLAEARRELWRAVADLQGWMQLETHEDTP